eukprot:TRINITY_DN13706_c0_g1_i2.p1 TRINITY_DN13706_c0_g1~~TRINITY_DN13706_c0_g1_i2.p1  ORF type:complete len:118 (+),score=44.64 TRINITY_DN13706_c0_g1_i2:34-387(+)
MIRRPPRSTQSRSSAASDVYKRQLMCWPLNASTRIFKLKLIFANYFKQFYKKYEIPLLVQKGFTSLDVDKEERRQILKSIKKSQLTKNEVIRVLVNIKIRTLFDIPFKKIDEITGFV